MERSRLHAAVIVALLAAATGLGLRSAGAQAGTKPFFKKGGIEGTVVDARSKPMMHVTVSVAVGPKDTGADEVSLFTNSLGQFSLFPLEPGVYFLSAYFGSAVVRCAPLNVPASEYSGSFTVRASIRMPADTSTKATYTADCFEENLQ